MRRVAPLPLQLTLDDTQLRLTETSPAALPPVAVSVAIATDHDADGVALRWEQDDAGAFQSSMSAVRIIVRSAPLGDGLRLVIAVTNATSHDVELRSCSVTCGALATWWASLASAPAALRVAYCGAHSRSPASRSFVTPLHEPDTEVESWWVGAISGASGPGLVAGGVQPERFVTRYAITRDGLRITMPLEHWTLAPGETLELDPLWIACTAGAPHEALEQFATHLGEAQHARAPQKSPAGWGSWGHWLERIDAGLMREMVQAIDGSVQLRRVIDVVQIDDGWSELLESRRVSASWRPNQRFPSGLAPLATEIERTGRRCGLWLLPFTVNQGSPIIESHPQWLVQNADGTPLRVGGGESYCLDPTHPAAAAWLSELLQRFTEWGIDYIKLDFLRSLLAPDPALPADSFDDVRRYHGARTRLEAYRRGLAVIRAAVGDATTIVACSAPAAAGVGLIDCHRLGPDIEREWVGRMAGVRDAARSVAANWFWHGRTWVNDPDYLLVCESVSLTQFWATVVALSGGSVIVSADVTTLEPWAESMLAFILPPVGRSARPIDLFATGPEPRRWVLPFERDGEAWSMLGLFNWDEAPTADRLVLDDLGFDGAVHVWDAWRQRHSIAHTPMTVPLGAQSAALLRLTPVTDVPTVVGSEIHWAQGWMELASATFDDAAEELRLVPAARFPRPGRVWIWIPDGWRCDSALAPGDGPLRAAFLDGSATIVIKFSRSHTAPLER